MLQQRVPQHGGKQEGRVDAHVVLQTVIGVLQHLHQNALHRRIVVRREVAGDQREQRLEQLVFAQLQVGLETVTRLQQLEGFFEQARRRDLMQQRGRARIGSAVSSLMRISSLAAKRTARSMRTGSSR